MKCMNDRERRFRKLKMKVLLTSYENREKDLLEELRGLGRFERTRFRNTLLMEIDNLSKFLDEVKKRNCPSLSKVIPILEWFEGLTRLEERLKTIIEKYAHLISTDETFCIRVERRGMERVVNTRELEINLGAHLVNLLENRYQRKPKVNLTDPDKLIKIETLGTRFGIGIIPREIREKYQFVR